MGNRPRRQRSERVRQMILRILEDEKTPLTAADISYRIDSTSNLRCSVYSVGLILRLNILRGEIRKTPIVGSNRFTYELIN